ncbi:MAG: hypothetical protein IKA63_02920 [Clostridia bacterium]|nr:hypothetical protein [Clostridia bacterium]
MGNRKFFRRAFRGFHRQDVLAYIDNLRAEQQREVEDLQAQLTRLQEQQATEPATDTQTTEQSEQAAVLAQQVEQLNREQAAERAENDALRAKAADYEKEIQELRTQLEECNRTLASMWEEQRQLQQSAAAAQDFSADVRALGQELCERIEACARQRFGGEIAPSAESEVPSNEPQSDMERWLF